MGLLASQKVTITLRLKQRGRLAVSSFVTVAHETVKALRELEAALYTGGNKPSEWYITSITMGDAIVFALEPSLDTGFRAADEFVDGLRLIKRRNEIPPRFPHSVFQHAKRTLSVQDNGVASLLMRSPQSRVRSTPALAKRVDAIASEGYDEWTTLIGLLDAIRWDETRPRFHIADRLTGNRTECVFDPDDFARVKDALPRRVEVSGLARFNRLGEPLRIKVSEWETMPDDRDLPHLEDLRNVNITDGLDAAEHVWRLRDGG